jgi:hypothetical protein
MRITKHEKSYIVELSDRSDMACGHGRHFAMATDNGTWC